jgi:hypothetical protein
MALFDDVFNKSSVYQMLFFNIKAVLIYPTLDDLKTKNLQMFERWKYLSKVKYNCEINEVYEVKTLITNQSEAIQLIQNHVYEENAVMHPEFVRIVAISYATLYSENGVVKRHLKAIANEDEVMVIEQFMSLLDEISSDDAKSSPQLFSILCGHNIISYDLPLLIKRFIVNREKFQTNKQLPYLLKRALNIKPWESGIIDTVNVWKFNGFEYSPLMLIADFLGLKKKVDLETHSEISKQYWTIIANEKSAEAIEFVSLQSATQTNIVVQLMNELRQI